MGATRKSQSTAEDALLRFGDIQSLALCCLIPYLSELKISWAFAAVPLHFQDNGWPLLGFGTTIGIATLGRIPMNWLLTVAGDWVIVIVLAFACVGAVLMFRSPNDLLACIIGIAVGHVTDTAQVQASLCYRWKADQPEAQQRALRIQAISATFGYSSGALVGGALFEYFGFYGCALLQLCILSVMTLTTGLIPVVHASFRERFCPAARMVSSRRDALGAAPQPSPGFAAAVAETDRSIISTTTSHCLHLPAIIIWLCDGANIMAYITEWTLFAVFFHDEYQWSSTLTGAAQMAGDLIAALILGVTATRLWARLLRSRQAGGARQVDRMLFQPPFNIGLFFASYAGTFAMLASPLFAVSVLGQVLMGTVYVFNKQAVMEAYLILAQDSLTLFRRLEFVGSCCFNCSMALASVVSVILYEEAGRRSAFYIVAAGSGLMALVVFGFFGWRPGLLRSPLQPRQESQVVGPGAAV